MENILSQQNMDSVKALAETNMKVSEAKNLLFKLQEEETDYLVKRENKVMDRIKILYDQSVKVFKEIKDNYQGAKEILQLVTEAVTYLSKSHESFQSLLKDFEEQNTLWDKQVKIQEEKWDEIKKQINVDKILIKNDKEGIEQMKIILVQDRRKIDDDRALLERNINRFKENKL